MRLIPPSSLHCAAPAVTALPLPSVVLLPRTSVCYEPTYLDRDSGFCDCNLLGVAADGELVFALLSGLYSDAFEHSHSVAQLRAVAGRCRDASCKCSFNVERAAIQRYLRR